MVLETALLWWVWLACVVFVVGNGLRALKYARAPDHLRWDLYPVAHEPGDHGGSYLEQKEWWTKPRHKSHFGAIFFMAEEILLLRGVWKHNRPVWWGSLPFHWGLYGLIVTTVGLAGAAAGFLGGSWLAPLAFAGLLSGGLLTLGSLVLLWLRWTDPKLRPYTSPLDLMNLALLAVLGGLSVAVAAGPAGLAPAAAAVGDIVRFRPPDLPPLLAAQMAVAGLFLLYFPMTRMVHLFAKYFTYHSVRWDDRPRERGTALDRRLTAALDFGVDWSAEHVRTGKTWAEVATTLPGENRKAE